MTVQGNFEGPRVQNNSKFVDFNTNLSAVEMEVVDTLISLNEPIKIVYLKFLHDYLTQNTPAKICVKSNEYENDSLFWDLFFDGYSLQNGICTKDRHVHNLKKNIFKQDQFAFECLNLFTDLHSNNEGLEYRLHGIKIHIVNLLLNLIGKILNDTKNPNQEENKKKFKLLLENQLFISLFKNEIIYALLVPKAAGSLSYSLNILYYLQPTLMRSIDLNVNLIKNKIMLLNKLSAHKMRDEKRKVYQDVLLVLGQIICSKTTSEDDFVDNELILS